MTSADLSKAAMRSQLKSILEKAGGGWVFRYWGNDADRNLDKIAVDLRKFVQEYHRRFGEKPDPLTLMEENPQKGVAFFHVDTLLVSVEMKIMIWRILLGCEIAKVEFKYEVGKPPVLSITLSPPYGVDKEHYASQQPADYRVLRHIGATAVNGQLFLQGYYAARGT
jgi:hypothetical protein